MFGGVTGKKRSIIIHGKKFIIKPNQGMGEQIRRRQFIDEIKSIAKTPAKNNVLLEGKTFILKISKRYPQKRYSNRIEPLYKSPTLGSLRDNPYDKRTQYLIKKSGLSTKELQKRTEVAVNEMRTQIGSLSRKTLAHTHDILVDYENEKIVFRYVDF